MLSDLSDSLNLLNLLNFHSKTPMGFEFPDISKQPEMLLFYWQNWHILHYESENSQKFVVSGRCVVKLHWCKKLCSIYQYFMHVNDHS